MTTDRTDDKMKKLIKEFLSLLDIEEESDNGHLFKPNQISSCRVFDGQRINEILEELKKIVNFSD